MLQPTEHRMSSEDPGRAGPCMADLLEALRCLTDTAARTRSLDEILRAGLDAACRLVRARGGAIHLPDQTATPLVSLELSGASDPGLLGPQTPDAYLLTVPLTWASDGKAQMRLVGRQDGKPFSSTDQEVLTHFAGVLGLALNTVCGHEAPRAMESPPGTEYSVPRDEAAVDAARDTRPSDTMSRQLQQLLALHQFSEVLHQSARGEHVFEKALQVLCSNLGTSRAAILLSDKRGILRYVVWRGLSEGYRRATERPPAWPSSVEPRPILIADASDEAALAATAGAAREEGVASMAFLPLSHQREVIGQISLYFDTPRSLSDEELRLALTVAEQLALAIVRQRAVDEVQRLNSELEERVRRRTAQLEQANRELEAFSYSVSHDLRAPLRALDGFSRILIEEYGDLLNRDANRYLDRIIAASARMERLIDDMLKLSRVGRSNMRLTKLDLSALVSCLLEKLVETDPQRRVVFTAEDGLIVEGDRGLLTIALENLLGNAWKYSRGLPETRIHFGREKINGRDSYFVRDNGTGFDLSHASRLFTPFHRLHSSTDFEGSGIGLAIVQRIVHRHGGKIWADSRPGRGSVFRFTLWEEGVPAELREAVGRID